MNDMNLIMFVLFIIGLGAGIGGIYAGIFILNNKNMPIPLYSEFWFIVAEMIAKRFVTKEAQNKTRNFLRIITGIVFIVFGTILLLCMAIFLFGTILSYFG